MRPCHDLAAVYYAVHPEDGFSEGLVRIAC